MAGLVRTSSWNVSVVLVLLWMVGWSDELRNILVAFFIVVLLEIRSFTGIDVIQEAFCLYFDECFRACVHLMSSIFSEQEVEEKHVTF